MTVLLSYVRKEEYLVYIKLFKENKKNLQLRARSHLATATQVFDIISMLSEMGCIVTNVTVWT